MSNEPEADDASDDAEPPVEEHPYRGEELGGTFATVCTGFAPEPIRYLFYQPGMRILLSFGLVVALVAAGAFAAGYALRIPGGWWPGFLAFLCYGLGGLLVLIELIVVAVMVLGYNAGALCFKNALLTPGLVLPGKPLGVVVLAPLGDDTGPVYHGIQRLTVGGSLPYHSHAPGTRVPVVSAFVPAKGLDRWLAFSPELICWGTGSHARIEQCFHRLGTEDFERLEACVARGLIPSDDDELILLDENDNKLESLSIREEKKKYKRASN